MCKCKGENEAEEAPQTGNDVLIYEGTFQTIIEMKDLSLYWNKCFRHVAL